MNMIDPEKLYWFTTGSGRIEFQMIGSAVADIATSGDNAPAVDFWFHEVAPCIEPAALIDELREYGAWDDDELSDHWANLRRLVWLAAHDIKEAVLSGEYAE